MSKRGTVLSVDDSLTIRKLIESTLRPAGYEVLLAVSGEEGLRLAREARPDLILLDYVLPDMRGVEFCQQLQADENLRLTPVLLISGHGGAIQELYRDCANVVDYLTKPFAANVLQAVVTNILDRGARPAVSAAKAPAADPEAPPREATEEKPEQLHAELRQRIFNKLVDRVLHVPLAAIPAWEAARGEQDPVAYYLARLLPLDLVEELANELAESTRRQDAPTPGTHGAHVLQGSTKFVSERDVLIHLQREEATGELSLTLPEEVVTVYLSGGALVCISSNHPRYYCAGSSYPFLQVPHAIVSLAMSLQREAGVPFFITARERGFAPQDVDLPELLRTCGHRSLARVTASAEAAFRFQPLKELPKFVREYPVEYSLPQLLLESYRMVRDWQDLLEVVPRLELYVGRTDYDEAYLAQLQLDSLEVEVLKRSDFRHTVQHLQDILDVPPFDLCRAIYCLARLDLCYLSDLPLEDEVTALQTATPLVETDEESAASEELVTTGHLNGASLEASPA